MKDQCECYFNAMLTGGTESDIATLQVRTIQTFPSSFVVSSPGLWFEDKACSRYRAMITPFPVTLSACVVTLMLAFQL